MCDLELVVIQELSDKRRLRRTNPGVFDLERLAKKELKLSIQGLKFPPMHRLTFWESPSVCNGARAEIWSAPETDGVDAPDGIDVPKWRC